MSILARTSLIFVLGTMFLALSAHRMEALKLAVAKTPAKSLAGGLVGIVAGAILLATLCVTIIGIPFAIVAAMAASLLAMAGASAVLETAGAAVIGHRTSSPYAHLFAGCVGLLILNLIPKVGGIANAAVFLMGIGAVVLTRGAGMFGPLSAPSAR